jgi:mono/diheme cytochrome c family protein
METIITLRLSRTEWEGLVNDMISRGAPAFDNDHELIINYLATNFGPNSRVPESTAAEEVLRTGAESSGGAAGKQLVDSNCARCHALSFVTNARHTRDEWQAVVNDMISRGATLDGDEIDSVVQYLADAYGPGGSGAVAGGATPSQSQQDSEDDEEAGPAGLPDGPGRELVATVCTQCHGLNNVVTLRLTAEEWEGLVNDMISRGAPAFDDQYKIISQYLSTNFGK